MKFIYEKPALLWERTLVVADLHIGIERELFGEGVSVGDFTDIMLGDLLDLLWETGADRLVMLGDVKHNVPIPSEQEARELPDFFRRLASQAEVIVVKGNHDGNIEKWAEGVKGVKLYGAEGFVEGNVAFAHGHAWPLKEAFKADFLITAHNHPVIEFVDRLGYRSAEKVWVVGKLRTEKLSARDIEANPELEMLVVPAFSELVGGLPFNARQCEELLGPLFQNGIFKLDASHIFLLSGVELGELSKLRR